MGKNEPGQRAAKERGIKKGQGDHQREDKSTDQMWDWKVDLRGLEGGC